MLNGRLEWVFLATLLLKSSMICENVHFYSITTHLPPTNAKKSYSDHLGKTCISFSGWPQLDWGNTARGSMAVFGYVGSR